MKNLLLTFILVLFLHTSFGQEVDFKSNFSISVVTDSDYLKDLDSSSDLTQKLKSKLLQMVSNYGISGVDFSDRFVLYPDYRLDEYKVIENTTRNIHIVRGELTLFVKENESTNIFGTLTIPLEGTGRSKSAAYLKTISSIKTRNDRVEEFLDEVKAKIIDSYKRNCLTILNDIDILIENNSLEKALKIIAGFPSEMSHVSGCAIPLKEKAHLINRKIVNEKCLEIIKQIEDLRSDEKQSFYALALVNYINKDSKCYSVAMKIKSLYNKRSNSKAESEPSETLPTQEQEDDEFNIDFQINRYENLIAFEKKKEEVQRTINEEPTFLAKFFAINLYPSFIN